MFSEIQLRRLLIATLSLLLWAMWPRHTAMGQGFNQIKEPVAGETISGVLTITGTAAHPDFQRYELAFISDVSGAPGWIVFAEGGQPVPDGVLAVWDTTVGADIGAPVFPDGIYQLRLRVIRHDYNYDEFFVTTITLSNSQTPTPSEVAAQP